MSSFLMAVLLSVLTLVIHRAPNSKKIPPKLIKRLVAIHSERTLQ
jgi:hypothetical protein